MTTERDQATLLPQPTGKNQRAEVAMTTEEIDELLRGSHTATMSTIGPRNTIHSVAIWYGYIDGALHMEAKEKSQKVKNLRRDPRLTMLVHAGYLYDEMRGVMIEGTGTVFEDDDLMRQIVHDIFARYHGIDDPDPDLVEQAIRRRVIIRLEPERVASWDHRKLPRS
jgi:PPOX class probable F420-dependent enzyme